MYDEPTNPANQIDLIGAVEELRKSVTRLDMAVHGDRPDDGEKEPSTTTPSSNRFQVARTMVLNAINRIDQMSNELKQI